MKAKLLNLLVTGELINCKQTGNFVFTVQIPVTHLWLNANSSDEQYEGWLDIVRRAYNHVKTYNKSCACITKDNIFISDTVLTK